MKYKFRLEKKLKSSSRNLISEVILLTLSRENLTIKKMLIKHLYRGSTPHSVTNKKAQIKKFSVKLDAVNFTQKFILRKIKIKYRLYREC